MKRELAGRKLSFEFGRYAEQAAGSVLVRYGDTVVLVCATVADTPRPGIDFFPLGVDFEEKQYSVGKIPGGFIKREGRPTEKAILTSRLIDRPLRPLFPKGMRNDVSVVATVLSNDNDCSAEIPAMIGSSVALCVSEIPFAGPTGSVVVGLMWTANLCINPTVRAARKERPAPDGFRHQGRHHDGRGRRQGSQRREDASGHSLRARRDQEARRLPAKASLPKSARKSASSRW